jgi:hypothetical protein
MATHLTGIAGSLDMSGVQFYVTQVEVPKPERIDSVDHHNYYARRSYPKYEIRQIGGNMPKLVQMATAELGRLATAGVYVAVPLPKTTAQHLALSVLLDEPCERQFVDAYMEETGVDPEDAVLREARSKERHKTLEQVRQAMIRIPAAEDDEGTIVDAELSRFYHLLMAELGKLA